VGHAGTLDPDATGLLVLCLGKATKSADRFSAQNKTYRVKFLLGRETDTYDSTGKTVVEKPVQVSQDDVKNAFARFEGEVEQRPPIYSAVKVSGRPLYDYARKGMSVQIPTRKVKIHSISILSFEGAEGEIEVNCSKGTYVRSLVHDVGQLLKTGAITTAIRRMSVGILTVEKSCPLDRIVESPEPFNVANPYLLSVQDALGIQPVLFPPYPSKQIHP
jgi:tRNA pseudouridine55 synthase